MARGYRSAQRYAAHHSEEKESFWVSYSDLLSGILVVFILVIMIMIYNAQQAYEEKAAALEETEATLEENKRIIEEVVGVKARIIEELIKAFQDSDLQMEVDPQTGTIRFSGGVFFEKDSAAVSAVGASYLKQFIPRYVEILLSDAFKDEIAQIIVEGHTDTEGGYIYNLKLSQNRAFSVVTEIFNPNFPKFSQQEELKRVITANGRSFSFPIYNDKQEIDAEKSRRVEFKFRLKDEQSIDTIQKLVSGDE
ncbi:OmpA family protein [Paenibacillus sp. TRM 82003]|nr:OmpA family protein [Paenibacillus sp. TRM 82003]